MPSKTFFATNSHIQVYQTPLANLAPPGAQEDGSSSFVQGLFDNTLGGSSQNSNHSSDPLPGV